MCDFCEKGKILDCAIVDCTINGTELCISYDDIGNHDDFLSDSSFSTEIKIKFCPMCGTELGLLDT